MSISINYVAWDNSLNLTWSKKEMVVCESFFYLKNLKFTFLKYFLAYLGSSVKTTSATTVTGDT